MLKKLLSIAVFFCGLFLGPVLTQAEITSQYDWRTEERSIRSEFARIGPFSTCLFIAKEEGRIQTIAVVLFRVDSDRLHPSDGYKNGKLKIGTEVYDLPVFEAESSYLARGMNFSFIWYDLTRVASQIQTASEVKIKVGYKSRPSIELDIPFAVLSEWQEVLKRAR